MCTIWLTCLFSVYCVPNLGHSPGYWERAMSDFKKLTPGIGDELVQCGRCFYGSKQRLQQEYAGEGVGEIQGKFSR